MDGSEQQQNKLLGFPSGTRKLKNNQGNSLHKQLFIIRPAMFPSYT